MGSSYKTIANYKNGKLLFNQKINDFILKNKCSWENLQVRNIIKIILYRVS